MPTYSILGANGNTGSSLITLLLPRPNVHINAFVRSKSKLLHRLPNLEAKSDRLTVFQGGLDRPAALAEALYPHVDAVFCATGSGDSTPGMRIAQDSAHGLVVAICHIRAQDPHYKPPRLIFLSSATVNPRISRNSPWLVHHVVYRALAYAYRDLELAEQFMRLHESWLNATFVQPGALTEDVQKGHALSLDDCPSFVSYLDLAAGMIEIAESGKYEWQGVSVMGTGKDIRFEPKAPKQILRGFLFNFFPWTYPIAQYLSLM